MANRRFTQFVYNFHRKRVDLDCKFTVLSTAGTGNTAPGLTNAGGFGQPSSTVTSYGGGIQQVLGYSSAPATGNNFLSGTFGVQLQDNYLGFLGATARVSSVVTGAAVNVTTSTLPATISVIAARSGARSSGNSQA